MSVRTCTPGPHHIVEVLQLEQQCALDLIANGILGLTIWVEGIASIMLHPALWHLQVLSVHITGRALEPPLIRDGVEKTPQAPAETCIQHVPARPRLS